MSFTANHAHLVPEGIAGFVGALDMTLVEEVRLADCFRNGHEVHLAPGDGDIDFADMFRRIEGNSFRGHYMNAFGSLDDMLAGRAALVRMAEAARLAWGGERSVIRRRSGPRMIGWLSVFYSPISLSVTGKVMRCGAYCTCEGEDLVDRASDHDALAGGESLVADAGDNGGAHHLSDLVGTPVGMGAGDRKECGLGGPWAQHRHLDAGAAQLVGERLPETQHVGLLLAK